MVILGNIVEMPAAFMFFAPASSLRKTDTCFLDPSLMQPNQLCGLSSVESQPNARHMTGDEAAGSTGDMDDVLE